MRGPSARGYFRIEWDYPVYEKPPVESKGGSVAARKRSAWTREAALKHIVGDDPRPLLVLRECKVCNGTDDALLKGGVDNERTFLLSRWFHCVKLPADVLEEDHPFHAMFTQKNPEHLFVCSTNGENQTPLESETSRTELWGAMRTLLGAEYKRRPDSSLKKIASTINKMDLADQRLNHLVARRESLLEEEGPKSRKLVKVVKDIAKVEADLEKLHKEVTKASDLQLKKAAKAKAL